MGWFGVEDVAVAVDVAVDVRRRKNDGVARWRLLRLLWNGVPAAELVVIMIAALLL